MYISEVARMTGASPRAIRLYESLGLLVVPRHGRYRVFDSLHVEFIQLIKEAQGLGVTLAELVSLQCGGNDLDWPELDGLLRRKREQLQQEITHKQAQAARIARYQQVIADCVADGRDRCEPAE